MMIEINGRVYPMWSQFVEKKEEFIGGILEDFGDSFDKALGYKGAVTKIADITLVPNGKDSASFSVEGKDFGCGFDVRYGGITGGESGYITFSGYGGHLFRIKETKPPTP